MGLIFTDFFLHCPSAPNYFLEAVKDVEWKEGRHPSMRGISCNETALMIKLPMRRGKKKFIGGLTNMVGANFPSMACAALRHLKGAST